MGHVLVVDDEKSIRITLAAFLNKSGYQVSVSENAEEAMTILGIENIDVVVSDILLPGKSGIELLNDIHARDSRIQVIMITGEPTLETALEGLRRGAFEYLTKPVSKDAILKTVRNAMRLKRLSDEKIRLEEENRQHREELERLVGERTQSLRESEERFQQLLRALDDVVFAATGDGSENIYLNASAEKLYGKPLKELFQNPRFWMEGIHKSDRETVVQRIRDLFTNKEIEFEYRIVKPDGEIRWLLDRRRIVNDEKGQPVQVAGIISDVTETKRLAICLEKLNSLQNDLLQPKNISLKFKWITDGILNIFHAEAASIWLIREGDECNSTCPHGLSDTNPRGCAGMKPCFHLEAVSGNSPFDTLSQNRVPLDFPYFSPLVSNRKNHVVSNISEMNIPGEPEDSRFSSMSGFFACYRISSQKGKMIGVMTLFTRHEISPSDDGLLESLANTISQVIQSSFAREKLKETVHQTRKAYEKTKILAEKLTIEINERKKTERALQEERSKLADRVKERTRELALANAELARASRLKDEFLANTSHELRTPLTSIIGLSEVLQEELFDPLTEKQMRSVARIEESGRVLLQLINDILDVSKIEAGKLDLNIAPIPIEPVCQSSINLVKQIAAKKKIGISLSIEPEVKMVSADKLRLKQIIVNLLNNAAKFTPEGGKIGLDVRGDFAESILKFTVWDTGIGISEKDVKKLFRPFVQLDSALSRQHEGTGLGLALVYRLTEMHGGAIYVKSTRGEGSRFTVVLPWKDADTEMPGDDLTGSEREKDRRKSVGEKDFPMAPKSSLTILLAEDNLMNIDTISSFLTYLGYRIKVANSGAEAIELFKKISPDLVLMDIHMPGMDGIEAIRVIREEERKIGAGLNTKSQRVPIIALTALVTIGDEKKCLEAGANKYVSKPFGIRELAETIRNMLI